MSDWKTQEDMTHDKLTGIEGFSVLPASNCMSSAPGTTPDWEKEARRLFGELVKAHSELEDWRGSARKAADERCGEDEHHCACVPALRVYAIHTKAALQSACDEVARLRGLISEMVDLADRDTTSIWVLRDSITGVLERMRTEVKP